MESHLSKAQHYRDQARQMRDLAAGEDSREARNALIHLAEMYERLCQTCLERAGHDSVARF